MKLCIIIPNEGYICLKPPTSKKRIVAQRTSNSEVDDKSIHKPNWPHGHSKQMISNQQTMPCQHDSLCMCGSLNGLGRPGANLKLTILISGWELLSPKFLCSKETSSRVKFLFDICWHLGCTKITFKWINVWFLRLNTLEALTLTYSAGRLPHQRTLQDHGGWLAYNML